MYNRRMNLKLTKTSYVNMFIYVTYTFKMILTHTKNYLMIHKSLDLGPLLVIALIIEKYRYSSVVIRDDIIL